MITFCKIVALFIWNAKLVESEYTKMLYMLLWNQDRVFPHNDRINMRRDEVGQNIFIENQCPDTDCFITGDRNYFGPGNMKFFNVIIFNGRNLKAFQTADDLPGRVGGFPQIFLFLCAEPDCYENPTPMTTICNPIFDDFFNMVATSRGNSDIVLSNDGNLYPSIKTSYNSPLRSKSAVVFFRSDCNNGSVEANFTSNLTTALGGYDQKFDVYGCGNLSCPKADNATKKLNNSVNTVNCDDIKNDYFFYLKFGHSLDNETESRLFANNSVPIFYGVDNRVRSLPLGTYIDATRSTPQALAKNIVHLINNPQKYSDFFRYRNRTIKYYPNNARDYVCSLCTKLRKVDVFQKSSEKYRYFRWWWDKSYEYWCRQTSPTWAKQKGS